VLQRLLATGGTAAAVPVTRAGLERQLRQVAGEDLGQRLQAWVDRAGELDYAATVGRLGLRVSERRLSPRPELGFTGELQGNELVIQGVRRGGPAGRAGLAIGDRVTAIDGRRPTPGWQLQLADPGRHELRVLRRGQAREHFLDVRAVMPRVWRLELAAAPPEVAAWRDAWLAP
jgi:predicted metalloprotease with PDZ domain